MIDGDHSLTVSCRVLAHNVAVKLEACLAREVIDAAFYRHCTLEIVKTDQGRQFTEAVLAQICKLSMDGHGAWRDNVFIERVWLTVKYEWVYLKACYSVRAVRAYITEHLHRYNTGRSHSSLRDVTPE